MLKSSVLAIALSAAIPAAAAPAARSAFNASMWLGVVPVEVAGEQFAEFRVAASAWQSNAANDYGNDGVFTEYNYIHTTPAQALVLADGLDAWADAPHSDLIFQAVSPDNHTGLAFTGTNWSPRKTHIVLARLSYWIGPGRNGGVFLALPEAEARLLAGSLRTWAENPAPASEFMYLRWLH